VDHPVADEPVVIGGDGAHRVGTVAQVAPLQFGGQPVDHDQGGVQQHERGEGDQPEEVQAADVLQFPSVASADQTASLAMMNWLIYISLMIGLIALVLAVMALRKSRS